MFEVFMVVKIEVMVFWDVVTCTVVVGFQRFEGPCCNNSENHDF
jgi:hypothetical protein